MASLSPVYNLDLESLFHATVHPFKTNNKTEPSYYIKAILSFAVNLPKVTHVRLAFLPGTTGVNIKVFLCNQDRTSKSKKFLGVNIRSLHR